MRKAIDPDRTLRAFRARIGREVYAEGNSEMHRQITAQVVPDVLKRFPLDEGAVVLDVGCGGGVALHEFRKHGIEAVGVTLSPEDLAECRAAGFEAHAMDQSFLGYDDAAVDFIWCRHAIEHSPFPYLTLLEFNRVLVDGGRAYIEVPAPKDPRVHESNPNHYSVLTDTMWQALFARAGFESDFAMSLSFTMSDAGTGKSWKETYLRFVIRKARSEWTTETVDTDGAPDASTDTSAPKLAVG